MVGRYYEKFGIDTHKGISNYTYLLTKEALKYIHKRFTKVPQKPFFLYWAPDSTHGPTYSSEKFRESSSRGSAFGDAIRELDNAIGEIKNLVIKLGIANNTLIIFTSDNGAALVSRQQGKCISYRNQNYISRKFWEH